MSKKIQVKKDADKKDIIRILGKALFNSLIWSILIYLCLTKFNDVLVTLLNAVREDNSVASALMGILFPCLFIINGLLTLGMYVIKKNEKK